MRNVAYWAGALALLVITLLIASMVFSSSATAVRVSPAGASTDDSAPSATPCPIHTVPDPLGDGCIKVTQTVTPTPIPCPTDMVYDPYIQGCVPITPTATPCPTGKVPDTFGGSGCGTPTFTPTSQGPAGPTFTATPCPTHQVPVGGACATITPTPTSQRPFGAALQLVHESPSPAISGRTKTWVFEIENTGSPYGCEPHTVEFFATLSGLVETQVYETRMLGCEETAQIVVASDVTSLPGGTIDINARATAGASPIMGQYIDVEDVIPVGSFDCDSSIDSVDAALILQLTAAMIQPLSCTGAGDVNEDGLTNAIDAALVLQYTAGLISEFA